MQLQSTPGQRLFRRNEGLFLSLKDYALEFVLILNPPRSHTRMTSIIMFQRLFSRTSLRSYDQRNWKADLKALCECCQCWIIWNVRRIFSESDLAQPESLVIGKLLTAIHALHKSARKKFDRWYWRGRYDYSPGAAYKLLSKVIST